MATEFVRVRDPKTQHESTVSRRFAEAYKLDILKDKPATNSAGRPLPGKPHVELKKADGDIGTTTETGTGRQSGVAR
jgi:hypothetical protein